MVSTVSSFVGGNYFVKIKDSDKKMNSLNSPWANKERLFLVHMLVESLCILQKIYFTIVL